MSSTTNQPPLLEVRGLTTEFATRAGAVAAVRDVSLTVRRSEKVAIVGESGCGKSTLALSILGLIDKPGRIASGQVLLEGRDLVGLSESAMKTIRGKTVSLIFQDPMGALDPIKTVGAQIIDTLRRHQPGLSHKAARARAVELLREVEVPAAERRLDDYPHHYSGGMRQRVMIAIALANAPDLIIADEPTTALDVTTQAQVLALLERVVADHGVAVLLITHNLGVVAEFCDVVQVMYAGRIVERGPTEAILARPTHPYTQALLESIPDPARIGTRLRAIPGMPPDLSAMPSGCAFEPRCFFGHGREICRTRQPAPVEIETTSGPSQVECHFATERAARASEVAAS
ncbi:ABC transporter ATP-binding protein [Kaistia granuli]|uniref:ABC transporter ATP-binding protein n=1 Tax=Kaistia granuli TaxID=363259 RepID=UPI00036E9368|nr:ABC transporter ATP-binding protein [Kaistia granuli]